MSRVINTHTYHDGHIAKRRVELNITVKELAAQVGVTPSMMGNYVTGKTIPNGTYMEAICDVLGIDFEVGKKMFEEDHAKYVATRKELKATNFKVDPNGSPIVPRGRNKKPKSEPIPSVRTIKHYTPWRQRFINTNTNYAEFAKYIGKERSSVSKYLAGKNRPDKETTQLFADYFKIPYTQAAEEFEIGYEQYHHIEHKRVKKLADIDNSSRIQLPEVVVEDIPKPAKKKKSRKALDNLLKSIYGKVDRDTYTELLTKGKISESKLRELYLHTDYDTFIEISKYLQR